MRFALKDHKTVITWIAFVILCAIPSRTTAQASPATAPLGTPYEFAPSLSQGATPLHQRQNNDTKYYHFKPAQGRPQEEIHVTPLDAPSPNAIGLLPEGTAGLPYGLWKNTPETLIKKELSKLKTTNFPAVNAFQLTALLIESAPPPTLRAHANTLFLSRIDALIKLGAIEQARALLEQSDLKKPSHFRRWFDLSLLVGDANQSCEMMQVRPHLAPNPSARIFCLARYGDWSAAALTLNIHHSLGDLTQDELQLLSLFLDPELTDDTPALTAPKHPTALTFKLYDAIGQSLPLHTLAIRFSHSGLADSSGLKQQLESAERLAKHGLIDPQALISYYIQRRPSASGGVWNRAKAIQSFKQALQSEDLNAQVSSLQDAWAQMKAASLHTQFSQAFKDEIFSLFTQTKNTDALVAGLLTDRYETFALAAQDLSVQLNARQNFLISLATGRPQAPPKSNDLAQSITQAFASKTSAPKDLSELVQDNQIGLSLLKSFTYFEHAADKNAYKTAQGLAFFRSIGLEDLARQTALQILLTSDFLS